MKNAPPVAKQVPHEFTAHGTTISDPWAWLKDPNYPEVTDQEVLDYLHAENAYFEAAFEPLTPLVDTLFEEMKARQVEDDESVPFLKRGYWYQWRFAKGAQYRTWYRAPEASPEEWQVLLDEIALAQGHEYFRLGALAVSPDDRFLAFSTDTDGSERFVLQVKDLDGDENLQLAITNTMGSPVWNSDSTEFLYVVVSPEWRPYQVWRHVLGQGDDELMFEEADTGYFVGLDLTQSEEYVLISTGGHTESEVHYLPRASLHSSPTCIAPRQAAHEYYVDHDGRSFVIRSNRDHPNFDIYRADIAASDPQSWEKVIAGDERTYITGHLALKDYLIVEERQDGLDQIRIVSEGDSHYINFPESAYDAGLGTNPNFASRTLRLGYTSMVTPNTVYDYDIEARQLTTLKVQEIPSGYEAGEYLTERLTATARDGAQVPISLVRHKDTPVDGSAPLYLYGYGAYGHAIPPSFSTTRISLLNRGFIYAIAHIRGGDDLGYQWYTDGKLASRTNTFNDFVDCARHLVANNYCAPGRIAIAGGSAGGELMGAVINQAPELWGAVAAHVPFVDVLNTMMDESLPLTPMEWPEWGNPIEDQRYFELIRSYSPYDQLVEGNYPAIMVTAGLNDPRVTYWEPAKYVAKLRTLKTDDNLLILKTNMGAGHGGKSGRFDSLRESAEEFAFFLNELS